MVVMQLELTMNMMQLKYIPGTLAPVNFRYILYPSVSDVGIVMVTVAGWSLLTYEGGGVGDGQHVPHYRGEDGDGKHDRHS